jgi:predicted PurR-regulated permease PerM
LVPVFLAVDVIFSLFAAILLAVFFRGIGSWVSERTEIPEGVSVFAVGVLFLGVFGLAIWLLAPKVADQVGELRATLPKALDTLRLWLAQYNWGHLIIEQVPAWSQIFDRFISSGFLMRLSGIFSTTVGMLFTGFVVILLSFYLASEPRIYIDGLIRLFPVAKRPRMREVVGEIGETLRWWLIGKFFSMLIIGVLTTIGLTVLGVPLALSLGLIAALLAFIPNFGPIIAVLPAVLFAFVESPLQALYVLILYLVIQTVESYFITPLIDRETVAIPPALTIIFQILLGVLVGGLGLVLATPLLAVIIVLVKLLYIEDVLGDKTEHISDENHQEEFPDAETDMSGKEE